MWTCIEINTGIICASIPAIKPLVVKFFPKMLLSELYARTRGYGNKSTGKGNTSGGSSTGNSGARSGNRTGVYSGAGHNNNNSALRSGNRKAIQVEQSFEMKSTPVGGIGVAKTTTTVRETSLEDVSITKEQSRDGSEKNLVASSWQDEHYQNAAGRRDERKKVTITSHPREIV